MPDPTPRPRLNALSSLRFLAAVHIFLFHAFAMRAMQSAPAWFQVFSSAGYIAVSFFFVLSGFVLVYTYTGREIAVGAFLRTRIARIYPVYLLSLVITAPFFFFVVLRMNIPEMAWFRSNLGKEIVLALTLLQAWVPQAALGWNAVGWALSVLIFFYVIFALSWNWICRVDERRLALIAALAWLGGLGVAVAYVLVRPDNVRYANLYHVNLFWLNGLKFNPLVRLPEFLAGIALARWVLRNNQERHRLAMPLVITGAATLIVLVFASKYVPYPVMHTGLAMPVFAAVIAGLALRPSWPLLEHKWLVAAGEASFTFYLLHSTVVGLFVFSGGTGPVGGWRRLLPAFAVSTIVSLLVYRFVEQPTRQWLRPSIPTISRAAAAS